MREVASLSPVSSNALVKIECTCFKFYIGQELTANCLVETHTKLEGLTPAVMVEYGLNRVQLPLWLQQSLNIGFSWYGQLSGIFAIFYHFCWGGGLEPFFELFRKD